MSDLRAAAQQTLDILESYRVFTMAREKAKHPDGIDLYDSSLADIRAALSAQHTDALQPAQEQAIDWERIARVQSAKLAEVLDEVPNAREKLRDVLAEYAAPQPAQRDSRDAALEEAISIVEEYKIPVGNSSAGELACDWTYAALREIREAIRALKSDAAIAVQGETK